MASCFTGISVGPRCADATETEASIFAAQRLVPRQFSGRWIYAQHKHPILVIHFLSKNKTIGFGVFGKPVRGNVPGPILIVSGLLMVPARTLGKPRPTLAVELKPGKQ